jgi:hypothetical protein
MKNNVGSIDKIIRLVLALGLFSLFFFLDGSARYWAILGVVPLATGLMNFCPLYAIFGLSTCPLKTKS